MHGMSDGEETWYPMLVSVVQRGNDIGNCLQLGVLKGIRKSSLVVWPNKCHLKRWSSFLWHYLITVFFLLAPCDFSNQAGQHCMGDPLSQVKWSLLKQYYPCFVTVIKMSRKDLQGYHLLRLYNLPRILWKGCHPLLLQVLPRMGPGKCPFWGPFLCLFTATNGV